MSDKIKISKYVHVTVTAGAKKELFIHKNEDHFKIAVKEKAERNMANTRILEIIANHFNVSKNKVRIVNGHHHPSKLLVID